MKAYIEATQIIIFWSDKTEGEICWREMSDELRQALDDWLSEIEVEHNEIEDRLKEEAG